MLEGGLVMSIMMFLLSLLFWGFHWTSFFACMVSMSVAILMVWFFRKDLIKDSLVSAVLIIIFAFPAYLIPELLIPGTLSTSWYYEHLTSIRIIGIPIEDLFFYFLFGLLFGPFYELITGRKQMILNKKIV